MKNTVSVRVTINSHILTNMESASLRARQVKALLELSPYELAMATKQAAEDKNWDEWQKLFAVLGSYCTSTYDELYRRAEFETNLEADYIESLAKLSLFFDEGMTFINTLQRQIGNEEDFDSPGQQMAALARFIPEHLDDFTAKIEAVRAAPLSTPTTPADVPAFETQLQDLKSTMYPQCETLPYTFIGMAYCQNCASQIGDFALHVIETVHTASQKELY